MTKLQDSEHILHILTDTQTNKVNSDNKLC